MRTEAAFSGAAQLRLLTWFSPAFPVGAFGYSHGLEMAIREGRATSADDLAAWIEGLLDHGSGWTDAVLFRLAWGAADETELAELAELAEALAPSLERRRETMQLGAAFLQAVGPWLDPPPLAFGSSTPYPIVAGWACGAASVALPPALTAWLHGFAANLISVAVRAIPIGQSAAVRILAALEPTVLATAERAADAGIDELGGCAFLSDIAAMRHETLQPRLFIS
jgi:urease accessory protein